jgi:hypothetical protein
MSSRQVAEDLGVEPATLAHWRYLNKGPAYIKVGRVVLYDKQVVEAWKREVNWQRPDRAEQPA